MGLYKGSSEEDSKMLDILLNSQVVTLSITLNISYLFWFLQKKSGISKLPNFVNYLDPVFSPMFHQTEINKHLVWLDRLDEITVNERPDAVMRSVEQKCSSITLGFCEVKPSDCTDSTLLCTDLYRLAKFSKTLEAIFCDHCVSNKEYIISYAHHVQS